ncbi:hypothetical protein OIO90_002900 [Microbotryomycetes sp. JL221]|nr:hypothetical protein OIO90_002900 [Microbotryomycetes sp. JL221]
MSSLVQTAFAKLVQPGDEAVCAFEILELPSEESDLAVARSKAAQRCLGLVSHHIEDKREAALIVFRRPTTPTVVKVLPLEPNCAVSITQVPRDSSSLANQSSSKATLFHIVFKWHDGDQGISFIVEGMPTALIAAVKASSASEADTDELNSSGTRHAWLKQYQPTTQTAAKEAALGRYADLPRHFSRKPSTQRALRSGFGAISGGGTEDATKLDRLKLEQESTIERLRWLASHLRSRQSEFTYKEDIRIWCGTYNVNDALPNDSDLSPWLKGYEGSHFLAFAFQELDLSTEAMIRYTRYREEAWREALEKAMGPRAALYQKLQSKQLVGALIIVYVLRSEARHVTSCETAALATGLMGVMANKGAVGIRLKYKDTWITFVNSHLAAFMNQTDQRNQMFRDTIKSMTFPVDKVLSQDPWTPNLRKDVDRTLGNATVYDTHHLIWIGDLNYRLDLPREQVIRFVNQKSWDMLLPFDQLELSKQHDLAFQGFQEAAIRFAPTFKFDRNSDTYDTSEKQRVPAWTDRILWMSLDDSIRSIEYDAHFALKLSDHKPVSALLNVPVHTIDSGKRARVQQELIEQLDDIDWDEGPDIKLLPSPIVEFESVSYMQSEHKTLTLVNNGRTIAEWSFVIPLHKTELCKPWLTIEPLTGLIPPGRSVDITLTIHVDDESSGDLNFSTNLDRDLSELLILSFEKRDFFLSVNAKNYNRTCFGNSLELLSKLQGPIRYVAKEDLERVLSGSQDTDSALTDQDKTLKNASNTSLRATHSVSVPVVRLIEFLAEHSGACQDLVAAQPDENLIERLRECLDSGAPFPLEVMLDQAPASPTPEQDAMELLNRLELEDSKSKAFISDSSDIGDFTLSPEISSKEFVDPDSKTIPGSLTTLEPTQVINTTNAITFHEKPLTRLDTSVSSILHCLLRFLKSLKEPLITDNAFDEALLVESREDAYGVLSLLPASHMETLLYIIAFLHNHIAKTESSTSSSQITVTSKLAILFSSVMMRYNKTRALPPTVTLSSIARRQKQFVLYLLEDPRAKVIAETTKAATNGK